MRGWGVVAVLAAALVALVAAPTASAERAIGVTYGNVLFEFDTATPHFTVERPITGLAPGTKRERDRRAALRRKGLRSRTRAGQRGG
jgi:hypothetical protein